MNAFQALVKRELLEHRGAFLYAPVVLMSVVFLTILAGLIFGDTGITDMPDNRFGAKWVFEIGLTLIFMAWLAYLVVALFFYYADSFSADRRNNALLFWKSMPQRDLTILGAKAAAGITIFPALVFVFAIATAFLFYLLSFLISAKIPLFPVLGPWDMVSSLGAVGVAAVTYYLVTLLWYAPLLAWVAGLSTVVGRWSIPLAFLIPGAVVLIERVMQFGKANAAYPVAKYLSYRMDGPLGETSTLEKTFELKGFDLSVVMSELLTKMDWMQLVVGLIFTMVMVYLASEYRRRRIEA